MLDLDSRKYIQARDRLRQAIEWQKKVLATNPGNLTCRADLTGLLIELTNVARRLGRDDEVKAARELNEWLASDFLNFFDAVDARLAEVEKGGAAKDSAERLALAQRAYDTRRYTVAAKLWGETLDSDPKLVEDRQTQYRYNAACAAALAATGKGKDASAPRPSTRTNSASERLAWLRAELAGWKEVLEKARPEKLCCHRRHRQDAGGLAEGQEPGGGARCRRTGQASRSRARRLAVTLG